MKIQDSLPIFDHGRRDQNVSVIIPLYNYQHHIVETLESVARQTHRDLCIIVIDDCSSDRSVELVRDWMQGNLQSGMGLSLLKNVENAKLAVTRNTGVNFTKSEFCFFIDADNMLFPRCIEKHLAALQFRKDAAAAYSLIEVFGSRSAIMGAGIFDKRALKHGNFIDAMSMIRRDALIELGGFRHIEHGWEDYDLWLRLCENGLFAIHIPEILSRYREHSASMLRTQTNIGKNLKQLHAEFTRLHRWLDLR